ncbi:hypothetical protein JFP838_pA0451 (plasmid) [Clostridium perfringens]|uniref:Uncharacterized protein n=1 Tax=Clostridium perfringens TaxID=1502 RepID=A0A140GS58_CLOPF|nr:hypothetical protein JFP838_pA0451 [Clostridium perfringens]
MKRKVGVYKIMQKENNKIYINIVIKLISLIILIAIYFIAKKA